jgi:formate-dependent nitrite reductase membrane component NrfD
MMFIGFEVLVVFLFIMYAHLTIGNVKSAVDVVMGGDLTAPFWLGVVLIGLILPALVELRYVVPALVYQHRYTIPRNVKMLVSVVVLVGGFMLRYVMVVAGQVTGANGI